MSDPLALLPLTLAAANGRIDGVETRRLVAAGVGLLQRTAPLVRALHGRRSAILLPPGPGLIVALAASEGRSALPFAPPVEAGDVATALAQAGVGAVFTRHEFTPLVPPTMPFVVLDEVPARARWVGSDGGERTLDLTSHDGLRLEGDVAVEGADEEVLFAAGWDGASPDARVPVSHRTALAEARAIAERWRLGWRDHTLTMAPCADRAGLMAGVVAPLLAGGRVSALGPREAARALAALEGDGVSTLVAPLGAYAAMSALLAARGRPLDAPVLQRCLVHGAPSTDDVQGAWTACGGGALVPA